ncbi:ferritin-like domain-containing protein [Geomonas sp.]|uniref:ferritin-like domain-containing protein n=1 Tax=Geomonas sp. TaxID=2651584 RepID=UPI002B46AD48|nr:ferritin-like domain-containing protein [Geomonas sp.]HJV35737.1 ferritin-like domain-containing protein [Geomonas sp.]
MDNNEMIDRLNDLIQLDVDAVEAYNQVLKHLEYEDLCRRLARYQDDHKNHIENLSAAIVDLGGTPAERKPDFKGYLMELFTFLMSASGSIGAVEVMKANEILTNRKYAKAAALQWPDEIKTVILNNYSQEQRHLRFIEEILSIPRHELR